MEKPGGNEKAAEPAEKNKRRGQAPQEDKKRAEESRRKRKEPQTQEDENQERSLGKVEKEQKKGRLISKKKSKTPTTPFDLELRRIALENARQDKNRMEEWKMKIKKRKNLEKTTLSVAEPGRKHEEGGHTAGGGGDKTNNWNRYKGGGTDEVGPAIGQ